MTIEITRGYSVEYFEQFYRPAEADGMLSALLALDMSRKLKLWRCAGTTYQADMAGVYGLQASGTA